MKTTTSLAVGILIALVSCQTLSAQSPITAENTSFALDFYKQHSIKKPGNVFFSPFSISVALSMVYPGARRETAEEIKIAMGFLKDSVKQSAEISSLIRNVTATGSPFKVVNTVWLQKGVTFEPAFLTITAQYFKNDFKEANFAANPEGARAEINKTIETQTNDKIKDLLPQGVITRDVLMVLTNAVYFKDVWASPFKKELTSLQRFYPASGGSVNTMFMQHTGTFSGFENEIVSVLELPYKNKDYSLVILLPKVDMKTFEEEHLTLENYSQWTDFRSVSFAKILLPRFKMTHSIDVKDILKDFGMIRSFDAGQADFTGIYKGLENMFISDILHKAFVDVNEEGTEAAAATAVVAVTRGYTPSRNFIADRPFIFIIRERKTQSILFMGKLAMPEPTK